MANLNAPSGLTPVGYLNGAAWTGGGRIYTILAADTNAYAPGDLVTTIGSAGADTAGIPVITLGAASTAARGVVVAVGLNPSGPFINPANLTTLTRPAATQSANWYAMVVDDPNVIYEIQEAGVGSVLTQASVNRNANVVVAAGASGTNVSGTYLDNNTVGTTSTYNLKILGSPQRADNTPYAVYQKWLVIINSHEFRVGTTAP